MSTFRLNERYDILFELMLRIGRDLLMTPMRSRYSVALSINKRGLKGKKEILRSAPNDSRAGTPWASSANHHRALTRGVECAR